MQMFLEQRGWSFWLQEARPDSLPAGAAPSRAPWCAEAVPAPRAVAVRMEFVGTGAPKLIAERLLPGVTNYFVGGQAERRTDVPGYGSVLYESVYPGIDVRVREAGGHCEYDLMLAPGADLAQVRVRVTGNESMSIDASGALVLRTAVGEVHQPQPTTWVAAADGSKRPIACTYVLHGTECFGFAAPARDATLPLVVDPPILYSTYFGGSAEDVPWQIIEDANGRILVCGSTTSLNFPTTLGLQPNSGGLRDGFLFCLDPTQPPASQRVFSTYFGGSNNETVLGITSVGGGLVAFAGRTYSTNLPVTANAFQPVHAGGVDGFLGLLDATGSTLLALTYFGGPSNDEATSVNIGPNGDLLVACNTQSTTLPTTASAYAPAHHGGANGWDGFVARFDLFLTTQLYGSYFGGSGDEWLWCWDVDTAGVMTLFGGTDSLDVPMTPGAFNTTNQGGGTAWDTNEAYVTTGAFGLVQTIPSTQPASNERIAKSCGSNLVAVQEWTIVYEQEVTANDHDILGMRLSRTGVAGTPFPIATGTSDDRDAEVS